ncbi:MAG TPA: HIT domain-containing protein [Bryobacteraceae bacterium]|nr:HIT domain-containing protein [Bryobacteraceae bacterium]
MDRLWSPWRYSYIQEGAPADRCIFCTIAQSDQDAQNFVLYRGQRNLVLLNLYPYTSGHLMIAPYEHVDTLEAAQPETLDEMIRLARASEKHLRAVYRPAGINLGMNIGEAAGAGVACHIHMHVLPRWPGDANFLSVIGETRVLPESLQTTYEKLRQSFQLASA